MQKAWQWQAPAARLGSGGHELDPGCLQCLQSPMQVRMLHAACGPDPLPACSSAADEKGGGHGGTRPAGCGEISTRARGSAARQWLGIDMNAPKPPRKPCSSSPASSGQQRVRTSTSSRVQDAGACMLPVNEVWYAFSAGSFSRLESGLLPGGLVLACGHRNRSRPGS